MKYIVYNNDGDIVMYGDATVPDPFGLGTVLESNGETGVTHYVLNGVITPYTPQQAAAKAATPDYPATWSNSTFTWTDSRSLSDKIAGYSSIVQNQLDSFAKTWGYDSILSAASYATSTITKFTAEGTALLKWRDSVWVWAEALVNSVVAGTAPAPATTQELLAQMPAAPTRPVV